MNELRNRAYIISMQHGFWNERRAAGIYGEVTALTLAISEICEAIEKLRVGDEKGVEEELADAIIRILDYCGYKGINIEKAIEKKMEINQSRGYLHGKKF